MVKSRKGFLFFGIIILVTSLMGFAFCFYIDDFKTLLSVSIISRFLQGIVIFNLFYQKGGTCLYTPCLSIMTSLFPDDI